MLGYVSAFKPFKQQVRNQLAIINETTIFVALITMFPFVFPELSGSDFHRAAKVTAAFVLTLILINVIWIVVYLSIRFWRNRRELPFLQPDPEKAKDSNSLTQLREDWQNFEPELFEVKQAEARFKKEHGKLEDQSADEKKK